MEKGLMARIPTVIAVVFFIHFGALNTQSVSSSTDNRIVIVVNSTQYTVKEGDTWIVVANYSSYPPATFVDWVRFNRVPFGNLGDRRSGGTIFEPTLQIKDISRHDRGEYEMFVNNSRGLIYGPDVNLIVWYSPCCTLLNNSGPIRTVVEDEYFDITVSIDAFPDPLHVDWMVNGVPVNRSTGRFVNGDRGRPSLGVRGIQRSDEGIYSITANNSANSILTYDCQCSIQIVVTYKPEMTCQTSGPIIVREGNTVQLAVTVQAKPTISFLDWLKNGQPVNRTSGRLLGGNSNNPNLTIQSIRKEDSGVFSVFSNNSVGSNTTCIIVINVQFPPLMECPVGVLIPVPEGSDVLLPVNIQANPPVVFLEWFKDGQPIDRTSGRFQGGNALRPNLTILATEPGDSGRYTVFSNNTVGSQYACNVTVDVQFSPRLSCLSPRNISVAEFSQFTLNIAVSSDPGLSVVEWFKNNNQLNRASGRIRHGNVNIPSLTVVNVQKNDTGTYTVYVNNSLGAEQGCSVYINVQYVPKVTCLSSGTLIVNKTNGFTIAVIVDANPTPSFVDWMKNGNPVDRSSGRIQDGNIGVPSLTIRHSEIVDSGTYSIFVNNSLGSVRLCNVDVIVQELSCVVSENITAQEGSDIQLTVIIHVAPALGSLSWMKNNQPLDRRSGRFLWGNRNVPTLTILSIIPEDSGYYTMVANNTVGYQTTCRLALNVQYSPRLSCTPPTNISVVESRQFTLSISVQSNPGLSFVEWFKDGKVLDRDSGRFQNGNVGIPSLTVVNVQMNDTGLYTVYVNNSVGGVMDCSFHVDVHFQPRKECLSPDTITVPERSSAHFSVSIHSNPAISFLSWFKDGRPLNMTSGRFRGGTITHPNLTILSTEPGDSGQYTVFSNNTIGSHAVCNVTLDVLYTPRLSCLSPSNIRVEEYGQFALNISIRSNPDVSQVEWFKNNVALDRSAGRVLNGNVNIPSLTVVNVQINDTGLYSVYVNNSIGEVRGCPIRVDVLHKPIVTCLATNSMTVNETDTFNIPVNVVAIPPASFVDWLKDSIPIDRRFGRFENGNVAMPSLTIKNIQDVDAGRYGIYVNNTVGSVETCDVDIIVQIKPRINSTGNYTVCETASVTLQCDVFASPAIHSLTWSKGGHLLDTSSPRYEGGTIGVSSLTIKYAVSSDDDVYHCSAANVAGSTISNSIYLKVRAKPSVTTFTSQQILKEDCNATLVCIVAGDPKPSVVIWYKNGIRIQTRSSRYINGNISNPSLTIKSAVVDDTGMYVCTAINDVGDTESQAINVTVSYALRLTIKYNNYGVGKGTTTVLRCEVEAFPPVTRLEWRLKDGTPVLPKPNCTDVSPSYKICNITKADSGIYQCIATNDVKTTISRDINVFVRDCIINVTDLRLSEGTFGSQVYNGRLEVEVDGVWGTVCGKDWTDRATQVVCGMLGFRYGVSGMYGAGSGPIHLGNVECGEQDTSINQCGKSSIFYCFHEQDIWLNCSSTPITQVGASKTGTANPTIPSATASSLETNEPPAALAVGPAQETQTCDCESSNIALVEPLQHPQVLAVIITLSVLLSVSVLFNMIIIFIVYRCGFYCKRKTTTCTVPDHQTSRSRDTDSVTTQSIDTDTEGFMIF